MEGINSTIHTRVKADHLKVSTKSLRISYVIDIMELSAVATLDIPCALLQADMDELVYVKFEGLIAELLSKIDPKLYENYMIIERGQTVLYVALAHPMYETLQASILVWRKLTGVLVEKGYQINLYDWYVANKEVNGSQ